MTAGDRDAARGLTITARIAVGWVIIFIGSHIPWYVAGLPTPIPETPVEYGSTAVVLAMFTAGAVLPLAMSRPWGRRFPPVILTAAAWTGAGVLLLRGALGLVDQALRATGLAEGGLTGLSAEEITVGTDPRNPETWIGLGIDTNFVLGGLLFAVLAVRFRASRTTRPRAAR